MGVFGCPSIPQPSPTDPVNFRPKRLKDFIAHILHRLKSDSAVVFCALYYLNLLKEARPDLGSKSGHALFFAAFVIAGKVLPDVAYNNKNLAEITEGMFPPRITNHMERELLKNLDWVVGPPDSQTASEFEAQVRARYSDGPKRWEEPVHRPEGAPTVDSRYKDYPDHARVRRAGPDYPRHQDPRAEHPRAPATIRFPPRADADIPAVPSAGHRSTHASRYPDAPRPQPPLICTSGGRGYNSDSSSATPSPVTSDDYEDLRARTRKPSQRLHGAPGAGDRVYVHVIPADAAFGPVAPRDSQRRPRPEDIYAPRVRQ